MENETPIEREIRMAKEREEELRKEKGIVVVRGDAKIESFKVTGLHVNEFLLLIIELFKKKEILIQIPKNLNKKDAVENDTRDVQHRIATNRIQQEIEEANERENELRTEGKILTTSEERVDAKVLLLLLLRKGKNKKIQLKF